MLKPNSRLVATANNSTNIASFLMNVRNYSMIAEPTHNCWQEVGKLNGRSLCKSRLHEGKLAYALDDHTVQLLHLANGKLELLKTGHTKRINNVVLGGGAILTASNDGSVRLYDERVFKQVGCFKSKFNGEHRKPELVLFGGDGWSQHHSRWRHGKLAFLGCANSCLVAVL
jgi:WD40 repeat protein